MDRGSAKTSRARWSGGAALAAILLLAGGASLRSTFEDPGGPGGAGPNVLVIVTDDQRGGLAVMPQTRKWLLEGGTTFVRGFVTSPVCCPSRASIMTGRYPHNHRVLRNTRSSAVRLDQSTTVQRHLRDAGYRTAWFGKYLNQWPVERPPPHFDTWATITSTPNRGVEGYVGGPWNVDGRIRTVSTYSTTFIGDRASAFIRSTKEPWLLYLAPVAPHRPFVPEPRYRDAAVSRWRGNPAVLETDRSDKPPYVQRRPQRRLIRANRIRAAQLRTLMSVDDMVGRVFEALREAKALSDTLVFFVSDNGHLWGEHGLMAKGVPYRQAFLVPFLARWPGRFQAGAVDRRWAANVDIAPTILEAAGIAPDAPPPDGRSLLEPGRRRDRILIEYWGREGAPPWASIVSGGYQYTEYYDREGVLTFRELYDVRSDPWQLVNLLRDGDPSNDPDWRELAALLRADRACSGSSCP